MEFIYLVLFAVTVYALGILAKTLYWRLRARGISRQLCAVCGEPYDLCATALCTELSGLVSTDRFVFQHGVLCTAHGMELANRLAHQRDLSDREIDKAATGALGLLEQTARSHGLTPEILRALGNREALLEIIHDNARDALRFTLESFPSCNPGTATVGALSFILYNYELRLGQFSGMDSSRAIAAASMPRLAAVANVNAETFTTSYCELANAFYAADREYEDKSLLGSTSEVVRTLGKRYTAIILRGPNIDLSEDGAGIDRSDIHQILGGPMYYLMESMRIAELCKQLSEDGVRI